MKRLFKAMVSLFCGLTLIAGVTACKTDVNSGDQVVEIGLFLTQTPVTPVNGDVTVDVTVVPKNVQSLKWLEGEKSVKDFDSAGTELTVTDGKASFTVSKSGNYTVYAKVNSKSEAVKTIFVEDVVYDLKDLITLSQSPAIPMNGDVVVEVTLNRQDVQLVKYAKGELEAEAFENGGTEVVKDENGKYTFTVSEKDWYTVYAKVNSKSFAVKKIDVEDVAFDVSGLISLSQSPASNVPTNAEVTVTALLSRSDAQTVKWAAGTHTVEDFATIRSTELTADEDGKYSFNVTENGTYTVYAQCNSKSKAVNVINVTNIDKVAPAAVTNLAANYVHSSRTINISWGNPAEADLDHAIVNVKIGDTVIVDDAEAKGNSYAVSDYTADNTTTVYISVKAADKAGNISGETTYSFVPKAIPEVQSITLDRYHISNTDTNRKITAIANISNMDALPEGEVIKIQVMDSANAKVNKTAEVDKAAGTATIEFDAPSDIAEYTVRVKIGNNAADTTHTVRLGVTVDYQLTKFTINNKDYTEKKISKYVDDVSNFTLDITVTGTNLDLGPVYLYWKNDQAIQYGDAIELDTSSLAWTATTGDSNEKTLNFTVTCPKEEGIYYLGRYKDENYIYKSNYDKLQDIELFIYGDVELTELYIPKVDISKEDTRVSAILTGNNFTSPDFDMTDIEISCSNNSIIDNVTFMKESDDVIFVRLTIPGTAGDYQVTARYNGHAASAVLHAQDYSSFTVGSVVLSDNSIITYTEGLTLTDEQKESAVGVIGGFDCYGVPFVLGKKTVGKTPDLALSTKEYYDPLTLYHRNYINRISEGLAASDIQNKEISKLDIDNTFTGEGRFGMVNTKVLKKLSLNGYENDFPAFYQCENYPVTQNLTGELKSDWYMPSIYDVLEIAKNSTVIDTVFNLIGGDFVRGKYGWSEAHIMSSSFRKVNKQLYDNYITIDILKYFYYVAWVNGKFDWVQNQEYDFSNRSCKIYAIKQY
ncbi:MAG: hypothetical protein SO112_08400 [Treponema sp.]|nr:hypothetical protein [Treponema sp.]